MSTLQDFQRVLARIERLGRRDWMMRVYHEAIIAKAKRDGFQAAYAEAVQILNERAKPREIENAQ